MLRDGWYRVDRTMFSHDVVGYFRDPLRFGLWQWMIATAYFRDSGGMRRGTFKTTTRQLSEFSGMHRSSIVRFVDELVAAGMLEVVEKGVPRKPSTYRVVNYDLYQSDASHIANRSADHSEDHKRTAEDSATVGVFGQPKTIGEPIDEPTGEPKPESLQKERSREQSSKNTMSGPVDGFALEGQPSPPERTRHVVRDASGDVWPKPQIGGIEYPAAFEAIWDVWKRSAAAAPKVVKNPGKMEAYSNVRTIIASGRVTHAQLLAATERFLDPFAKGLETFGCKRPPSFYNPRNGRWIDNLTPDDQTTGNSTTYTIDDFPNLAKLGAFLAIAMRAAEVEGAPGRPVPPDQAWEVFQAQSAEIQAQVRAEAGR
jgi:hypothetical protein